MNTVESKVEEQEEQNVVMGFASGFESFDEAKSRKEAEEAAANSNSKIPYFRTVDNGDYDVKIMPMHPEVTAAGFKGFSVPSRTIWLKIEKQVEGKKADKPINVKVVNAKQGGFSVDILAEYKYLAVSKLRDEIELAKGREKTELENKLKFVDNSSFNGGLRFDFKHLMWLLDMNNRKEGIQLYEAPHSVFKGMEDANMAIWSKRYARDKKAPCPITGVGQDGLNGSNVVMITKAKPAKKTEYRVMIDTESDKVVLTDTEISSLMAAPKLNSFLKYDKRQFQATLIYLAQYDAENDLGIIESPKFLESVETLKAELDAIKEDKSSFDLNKASKDDSDDEGGESVDGIKFDDILDEFDELIENGVEEKTDEMNDFRKKLRAYIKQEGISGVKVGRNVLTEDVINTLEDYVAENGERGVVSADTMEEVKSEEPVVETVAEETEEEDEEEAEEEEVVEEVVEKPATARRRRTPRARTRRAKA